MLSFGVKFNLIEELKSLFEKSNGEELDPVNTDTLGLKSRVSDALRFPPAPIKGTSFANCSLL